jgi:hypothetical protein
VRIFEGIEQADF